MEDRAKDMKASAKKRIVRKITPSFRVYKGGSFVRNFKLTKPKMLIGSLPTCDVVLDDREVSPQQCALKVVKGKGLFLVHLKGAVPTKIDGAILSTEKKLEHGNQIEIGPFTISVSLKVRKETLEEEDVPRIDIPGAVLGAKKEKRVEVKAEEGKKPALEEEKEEKEEKKEKEEKEDGADGVVPESEAPTVFEPVVKASFEPEGGDIHEEKTVAELGTSGDAAAEPTLDEILSPLDDEDKKPAVDLNELDGTSQASQVDTGIDEVSPLSMEDLSLPTEVPLDPVGGDLAAEPAEPVSPVAQDAVPEPTHVSDPKIDSSISASATEVDFIPPAQPAPESEEQAVSEPKIRVFLKFVNTDRAGQEIEINPDAVTIGRRYGDVKIKDATVSKRHLLMERVEEDKFRIKDLDSSNGTYVNGKRITEAVIGHGDKIELGRVTLELVVKRPDVEESDIEGILDFEETQLLSEGKLVSHEFVSHSEPKILEPSSVQPVPIPPEESPPKRVKIEEPVPVPAVRPSEKRGISKVRFIQVGIVVCILLLLAALYMFTPLGRGGKRSAEDKEKKPVASKVSNKGNVKEKLKSVLPVVSKSPKVTSSVSLPTPSFGLDKGMETGSDKVESKEIKSSAKSEAVVKKISDKKRIAEKTKKKSKSKKKSKNKKSIGKSKKTLASSGKIKTSKSIDEEIDLPVLAEDEGRIINLGKTPRRSSKKDSSRYAVKSDTSSSKAAASVKKSKKEKSGKAHAGVTGVDYTEPSVKVSEKPTLSSNKAIAEVSKALDSAGSDKLAESDLEKVSRRLKNMDKKKPERVAKAITLEAVQQTLDISVSIPMLTEVKITQAKKMDTEELRRRLKSRIKPAALCYLNELKRNPSARGKVTVSFTVKPNGRFSSASIVRSEINSASLHKCLKRKINSLSLGKAPGESLPLFYTFKFRGSSGVIDFDNPM